MRTSVLAVAVISIPALVLAVFGADPAAGKRAATFEGKDTLLRPDGYREWVFVGSSSGHRHARKTARQGEAVRQVGLLRLPPGEGGRGQRFHAVLPGAASDFEEMTNAPCARVVRETPAEAYGHERDCDFRRLPGRVRAVF